MSYGLAIYNKDNMLVINGTYRNMVLRQKVIVTAVRDLPAIAGIFSSQYRMSTTLYPNSLLAVRAALPSHRDKPISLRQTRGEWIIDVYTGGTNTSIDIEVFVFGYDESDYAATTTSYGLLLYNESGKLIFDSERKYIKILQYMYAALGNDISNGSVAVGNIHAATVQFSGDYAYMPTSAAYHDEVFAFDEEDEWYGNRWVLDTYFSVVGTTVKLDVKHSINRDIRGHVSGMPSQYSYVNPLVSAFMIDVTGY